MVNYSKNKVVKLRKIRFFYDLYNVTSGLIQKSASYKTISYPLVFICNHQKGNRLKFGVLTTFANLVVFNKLLCMFRKWRHYTNLPQEKLLVIIILNVKRIALRNSVYRMKKSILVLIQQASKDSKKSIFRKKSIRYHLYYIAI